MTDKTMPALRFRGFYDAWEQRKFSEVLEYSVSNNTLSRANLNYDHGEIKNIHYGDILVNFDSIVDVNQPNVPYVTDGNPYDFTIQLLQNGDVIIADTAEDETAGKVIEVTGITDNYAVSGLHTIVGRPNIKFAYKYLGYYLNAPYYHNTLLPLMQGIKVLSLSKSNIAKTVVRFPKNVDEQTSIGVFFNRLDNNITQNEHKLDLLKQLKQAYLQKIFSQELRFAGFSDTWQQRKLGETHTYFTDGNYGESYPSASDMSDKRHGVPFLRGSDFSNGYLDSSNANYIKQEKHNELTSGHIKQDDIILVVRGSLGTLGYATKENEGWNINSQLAILRTNKLEISGFFLIQYLLGNTGQREILSRYTGTALKQLPIKQMKDISVPIPNIAEQEKIGSLFKQFDNLITLNQQKLNLLKKQKQAFLKKMFI
ncbi:restriction endonuclease subunit S [Leuconostoc pseudomesenteroides]|uniref:restriction endonuclease subunit S n=1 Tax=Leuconostoc pseudomesenteroides TaxID=33968 RepID=UPI00289CF6C8|nr:restriction endonuclease subunit S [Leuconostoc pseudomesenteroides]